MNIAIVGSRSYNDYEKFKDKLKWYIDINKTDYIITGGAIGIDKLAERFAKENNIKIKIFLPEWKEYGKKAGYIRNLEIVQNSDIVIAFWDGESKGTKLTMDIARGSKKPLINIGF
jgi:hypothetical protein